MKEMQNSPRCLTCSYGFCEDAEELLASILIVKGDKAGALAIYEKIAEYNPMDKGVRMKLRLLQKKR